MNTNPQAKVVLCYGDSNTWGQNDDKNFAGRYESNVRWTGQLQSILGDGFYVIEEGLGGRTTNLEHPNPAKPLRNGLTYFAACLASHSPADLVVIMLGTNDLKIQYDRSVEEIAGSLSSYTHIAKAGASNPNILLISPIYIDDTAPKFAEYYEGAYDNISAQKSKELARLIQSVADKTGVLFFDASTVAKAGRDGIHFDKQSHRELAKSLSVIVRSI
ncbi:MAG TPA: GDSL-type esterase/lipase family protein [Candidatus Saccharimonadales bacterium]